MALVADSQWDRPYAIVGAGARGRELRAFLGDGRVQAFVDERQELEIVEGCPVLSKERIGDLAVSCRLIISPLNGLSELVQDVECARVDNFEIFDQRFLPPGAPNGYADLLGATRIANSRGIAIHGDNPFNSELVLALRSRNLLNRLRALTTDTSLAEAIGVPLVPMGELSDDVDLIIVNEPRSTDVSGSDWEIEAASTASVLDLFAPPLAADPFLKEFKDKHLGGVCVIVGNGPSLCSEDLDLIHRLEVPSFASNKIYKIFTQTHWRPTYYCVTDFDMVEWYQEEVEGVEAAQKFFTDYYNYRSLPLYPAARYLKLRFDDYGEAMGPHFSTDVSRGVWCGYTVTYDICLQLAAYMGFQTIVLIGVDNHYGPAGEQDAWHFYADDANVQESYVRAAAGTNRPLVARMEQAYRKAEAVSRRRGFRVLNATRGGHLEAFTRVGLEAALRGSGAEGRGAEAVLRES